MDRALLTDTQWNRIAHLLPGKPTDKGGRAADNRVFVEAVLWIARTGSPWRDLPEHFGHWHSVYVRFSRWERYGTWEPHGRNASDGGGSGGVVHRFHGGPRPSACSRRTKNSGYQALGRSRGGLSTKIHACVDALGNPLRLRLTDGQVADIDQAPALIEGLSAKAVVADKGYDSDAFVATVEQQGAQAVIPPRRNRKTPRRWTGIATRPVIWSNAFSTASSNSGD